MARSDNMNRSIPYLLLSVLLLSGTIPLTGSGSEFTSEGEEIHYSYYWDELTGYTSTVQVDPGDDFGFRFDPLSEIDQMLDPIEEPFLPPSCHEALDLVPEWMRINLTHRFRTLPREEQATFAQLIIDAENESYIDEIAFTISHLNVETLRNDNFFPELISHNARLIYQNAQYLRYVEILEKEEHTTLRYKNEENISTELPRDIYYWYVVIPDIGDEVPTYVDPEYNYVEDPPFDRDHGVPPPEGKFWREWLFYENKSGQPLLKDNLMQANTLWDAIRQINGWMSRSMRFTSDNERPNQPVRIYQKGIGRCGEYQDIRTSAARAGLIPVLPTSNTAEDHVWNEFWDGRWIHWDGSIDKPLTYENGWGKTISSVWNSRGDGYTWSVTEKYSEGYCTFTATVRDSNYLPVDGARVDIQTENFYQQDIKTTTISGSTDVNGKVTFTLGEGRNYWIKIDGGDLGSYPINPLTPNELLVMDAQDGTEYNGTYFLPFSTDMLRSSDDTRNEQSYPFRLDVSFDVHGYITRGRGQFSGGRFDQYGEDGRIDFLIADSDNFRTYGMGLPFTGYNFSRWTSGETVSFTIDDMDEFFILFSNGFSQWTTQIINISVKVYGKLAVMIDEPIRRTGENDYNYGDGVEVLGRVESAKEVYGVSISLIKEDLNEDLTTIFSRVEAEDVSTQDQEPWSSWYYRIDTIGMELGQYWVQAYAHDNTNTVYRSRNFYIKDLQAPDLSISAPPNNMRYRQGDPVTVTGAVIDNYALSSLTYTLDGGSKVHDLRVDEEDGKWSLSFDTGRLPPGTHDLTFTAEDKFENLAARTLVFEVLEAEDPYVIIHRDLDGSIHRLGDRISLKGSVEDESEIDRLMLVVDGKQEKDITGSLLESGDFNYGLDPSGLVEGVHTATVLATDSVGNTGSGSFSFELDGTAPTLALEPYDTYYPADGEILIVGRTTDDNGVKMLSVSLSGGGYEDVTYLLDRSGSFELDLTDLYVLDDGDHTIAIRSTDVVGNHIETTVDITVDGTAPMLSLNTLPEIVLEGEILQIIGTIDELYPISSGELTIQYMALDISDMIAEDTIIYTLDTGDLQVGTVEIALSVVDHVGNRAQASTSFTLVDRRTDSDGDGIPDWWEFMYVGLDPYAADSDLDIDGDGFTNLEEYLGSDGIGGNDDHTDPTSSSSAPTIDVEGGRGNPFPLLFVIIVVAFLLIAAISFMIIRRRKID